MMRGKLWCFEPGLRLSERPVVSIHSFCYNPNPIANKLKDISISIADISDVSRTK